jgi:hypothetical protein
MSHKLINSWVCICIYSREYMISWTGTLYYEWLRPFPACSCQVMLAIFVAWFVLAKSQTQQEHSWWKELWTMWGMEVSVGNKFFTTMWEMEKYQLEIVFFLKKSWFMVSKSIIVQSEISWRLAHCPIYNYSNQLSAAVTEAFRGMS